MTDEDEMYDPDRAAAQPLVGIDHDGAEHRFDQYHDRVYVLGPDGELEHVEELQPGELSAWVDYVADQRGWQECRFGVDDPFSGLVRALAARLESSS